MSTRTRPGRTSSAGGESAAAGELIPTHKVRPGARVSRTIGATKEDLLELMRANHVRFLRLQFTDILGAIKNVEVPQSQFEKALNGDIVFDGSSIEGFVRIEESDMILKPDYNTFAILPWGEPENRVARLICDVYTADGKPFEGDPRWVLKRQIQAAAEMGYEMMAGWRRSSSCSSGGRTASRRGRRTTLGATST